MTGHHHPAPEHAGGDAGLAPSGLFRSFQNCGVVADPAFGPQVVIACPSLALGFDRGLSFLLCAAGFWPVLAPDFLASDPGLVINT